MIPKLHFPLLVRTPISGDLHLLLWYEYNVGQHLMVAKTKKALLSVWERAFKDNRWGIIDPKEYWIAHTVRPTEKQHRSHGEALHQYFLSELQWSLGTDLAEAKNIRALPPSWKRCQQKSGEYDREHRYCESCTYGWVHEQFSRDDLLAIIGPRHPDTEPLLNGHQPAGPVADLAKPVMSVNTAHLGDHCQGISVEEEDFMDAKQALFYFQGNKLPVPREFLKVRNNAKAYFKAKKKEDSEKYRADQASHHQSEEARIKELLNRIEAAR